MSIIFFDVETGSLPEAEIAQFMPDFPAPKLWKDEKKIAEYVESARKDWISNAALDAFTGRVLAIGIRTQDKTTIKDGDDERSLINWFWNTMSATTSTPTYVGFNICAFDLPFLLRRSWAKNIAPPHWIRSGRYFSNQFVDLRDTWSCGDRCAPGSLDSIARFFGLPQKLGSGANFANLYAENKDAARAYLDHDLKLIEQIHDRMTMPL